MTTLESIAESSDTSTCDYCGLPVRGQALQAEPSYCCYGCRFAAGISTSAHGQSPALGPASALGLSVFFTMNVVMLTMALWSYADQPHTPFEDALGHFLRYGAMAFSIPVLLLLGRPLISHAVVRLRCGVFTTDLLLATGVLAAFALSIINTWRGIGHVYFEVGCVILVLVTLGRWLEAAGRSQASHALDQLEKLIPETVRLHNSGIDVVTARQQICVGDRIHVLAGERIPLDGCVERGRAVVDEQFFTGESIPVDRQPGDALLGGSLNLDGDLILTVTAPPSEGALGRLVQAVRVARLSKGRYQQLSDTWSQWFFPIITVVALATLIVHGQRTNWDYGLLTALSVVLIACPCALALATPMAIWTSLGTAAGKGVLCRSGAALEALATTKAIRWDKTGTLTTGTPQVRQVAYETSGDAMVVSTVAGCLTSSSNHLYSKAIREFLADEVASDAIDVIVPRSAVIDVQTIAGRGLRAGHGPDTMVLGSIRWMDDCGLAWGPVLSAIVNDARNADRPIVAVGFADRVCGVFLLEEAIRQEAAEAILECRHYGLDQVVLTGDRAARAERLGAALGLPVQTELLPDQKLAAIRAAHLEFGSVTMVGDGLNDAPALAAADIGIALGCGADVSRDSADICLMSADLRLIPWMIDHSRRTVRTIRSNLAWSFAYNSIGVIFAASGQLHPALAAVLMVISSLMVLGNSLRLSATRPFAADTKRDNMAGGPRVNRSDLAEVSP